MKKNKMVGIIYGTEFLDLLWKIVGVEEAMALSSPAPLSPRH